MDICLPGSKLHDKGGSGGKAGEGKNARGELGRSVSRVFLDTGPICVARHYGRMMTPQLSPRAESERSWIGSWVGSPRGRRKWLPQSPLPSLAQVSRHGSFCRIMHMPLPGYPLVPSHLPPHEPPIPIPARRLAVASDRSLHLPTWLRADQRGGIAPLASRSMGGAAARGKAPRKHELGPRARARPNSIELASSCRPSAFTPPSSAYCEMSAHSGPPHPSETVGSASLPRSQARARDARPQ